MSHSQTLPYGSVFSRPGFLRPGSWSDRIFPAPSHRYSAPPLSDRGVRRGCYTNQSESKVTPYSSAFHVMNRMLDEWMMGIIT